MRRYQMLAWLAIFMLLSGSVSAANTLRVLGYSSAWFRPYVEESIPAFEAAHPSVEISFEVASNGGGLRDRVVTEFAGGVPNDVLLLGSAIDNVWRDVLAQGLTRDHKPFLERDGQFSLRDFFPGLVQAFIHRNKLVGIPMESSTTATYINKALYDEAGLPYPPRNWDWNDMLRAAKIMTRVSENGQVEQWGFATDGYGLGYMGATPFLWANGGDIVDPAHSRATLLEPQAQEALDFFVDLHFNHRVSVPPGGGSQWTLFWQGKVAIWDSASWNISYNRQNAQPFVDWDIVYPLLSPRTGEPAPLVNGHVAAISSSSQQPDLAWEFIKHLFVSDDAQKAIAAQGMLPTRIAFGRYYVQSFQPPPENIEPVLFAATTGRAPVWFEDPQVHNEIWGLINTEWNAVMQQRESVRGFAEKVTPLINLRLHK
jgi:multiple sugar transport system substrate-binding protein